ncbi:hypothetical protein UT300012_22430 [Paraclostridium bifermentans]
MLELSRRLNYDKFEDNVITYNGYRIFRHVSGSVIVSNIYGCIGNYQELRGSIEDVETLVKQPNRYMELYSKDKISVHSVEELCSLLNEFNFVSQRVGVLVTCNGMPTKRLARFTAAHIWGDKLCLYNCNSFCREFNVDTVDSVEVQYFKFGERKRLTINLL